MTRDVARRGVLGGALGLAASGSARAQAWPTKPVKIICGYPPGGSTDAFARAYGEYCAEKLGQPFTVENKTGAASILACEFVAKSAPDGYTLLFTNSTALFQNQVTFKSLPYDTARDFAPVAMMPAGHLPLYIHADIPAKNLQEFVAWAKGRKVSYGTYAAGSLAHVVCVKLNEVYGLNMEPVHYRGEGAMWPDLWAGQIQAGMGTFQAASAGWRQGKIRPIAVPTMKRMASKLPDVGTFHEQGATHPYFLLEGVVGCLLPAATPRPIVERLSALMVDAGATPRIRQLNDQFGVEEPAKDWREFEKFSREMGPLLIQSVRELGLTPQ